MPQNQNSKIADTTFNESQQILLSFMDNLSTIAFVKDMDLRLVYVNRAFEKAVNLRSDELQGKNNDDLFPPDVAARFNQVDREVLKTGKAVEAEEFFYQGGKIHNYLARKFPIMDSNGKPYLLGGITIDITERKKMEEALSKATKEAEEANRLKDKFVSLVAHDIRSPSSSTANLIKIILDDNSSLLKKEHREILTIAMESCLEMRVFVDDVLNISTLRSGKIILVKRFLSVNSIISKEISKFQKRADEKGITISNKISDDLKFFVDRTYYSQVIMNLLDNAIKFSGKNDQIVFFEPEKEPGTIGITNSGCCIDKKKIEKLFDYESKTSTTGIAGEIGSGLGLPFSHDIMVAHGGNITVESEPGNGTTFYLKLPIFKPVVLIVDDDKLLRFMQREILKQIDVDIVEAENGKEAISIMKTQKPDLIITDIFMPVMDGLELLLTLKNDKETRPIPVIVVSSRSETITKEEV